MKTKVKFKLSTFKDRIKVFLVHHNTNNITVSLNLEIKIYFES